MQTGKTSATIIIINVGCIKTELYYSMPPACLSQSAKHKFPLMIQKCLKNDILHCMENFIQRYSIQIYKGRAAQFSAGLPRKVETMNRVITRYDSMFGGVVDKELMQLVSDQAR